ncbi:fatty acid desaturase [Roseovarius sp. MBR-6]|uniref:fatty acid desaturase n=1 Tax=Roseovarius sp. MBR-6 TaxID=3156459 RepID=UPI00339B8638
MTASDTTAELRAFLKPYTRKSDLRGAASFLGTLAVYGAALGLGAWAVAGGYWGVVVVCAVLLAFASVRLYVLQHDCGHHSLFETRWLNDAAGHVLSLFSLTPYRVMQYNHNQHHAYLGNLDHRETTEIYTMTVREWQAAPWYRRLWYRLYRNPLVMLPVGSVYTYFLAYRWPRNTARVGALGVIAHNVALGLSLLAVWALLGAGALVLVLASAALGGVIGVFMVYLQHNFEETYWDRKPELDFRKATLVGSSSLDLGWLWDLGSGNIAYHDLHHYNPGIPSYNLRRCQNDLPDHLKSHEPIRWPEALRSFSLKLWDEQQGRLVPFPRAHRTETIAAE